MYSFDYGLELTFVSLVFKSPKPFYLRYGLKKVFGVIFNSNNFFRELYEEWFCYLIPCYEVVYRIKKMKLDSTNFYDSISDGKVIVVDFLLQ